MDSYGGIFFQTDFLGLWINPLKNGRFLDEPFPYSMLKGLNEFEKFDIDRNGWQFCQFPREMFVLFC